MSIRNRITNFCKFVRMRYFNLRYPDIRRQEIMQSLRILIPTRFYMKFILDSALILQRGVLQDDYSYHKATHSIDKLHTLIRNSYKVIKFLPMVQIKL